MKRGRLPITCLGLRPTGIDLADSEDNQHEEVSRAMPKKMTHTINARITEYAMPPVQDALAVGSKAPVGCLALRRALALLINIPYRHIELDDPILSDILIREPVLKRVSEAQVKEFFLNHVKPLMDPSEVLHLQLEVEVQISLAVR